MHPQDELFEVFSQGGDLLGLRARSEVHRLGLWHKSAHVFLLDEFDRLLVQLRASEKDIAPDHWDLSVGEHLQPGESHVDAAHRGLKEELGIVVTELEPFGEVVWHRAEYFSAEYQNGAMIDCEIQQAFCARCTAALATGIQLQSEEVAQTRWLDRATLIQWLASERSFTPWFVAELRRHRVLERWFAPASVSSP